MRYVYDLETGKAIEAEDDPSIQPPTPQEIQEEVNRENRAYLASTDWYVVRMAETGIPVPDDILEARAAARAAIINV